MGRPATNLSGRTRAKKLPMRIDDRAQPPTPIEQALERARALVAEHMDIARREGLIMIDGSDKEVDPAVYVRYRSVPGVKALAVKVSQLQHGIARSLSFVVKALFAPPAIAEIINQREYEKLMAEMRRMPESSGGPLAALSDGCFKALFDDRLCARCGFGDQAYCICPR